MASSYYTSDEDSSLSTPVYHLDSPDSTCRVEILEQPMKKVRFRYLSELQGTPHGPLLGLSATKTNKTFPRVRLVGYEGRETVKIRCWLVDKYGSSRHEVRPHCHDLVIKKACPRNEIVYGPHDITVCRENNYTAVFENMVVLHCVQKDSECKYQEKELQWGMRSYTDNLSLNHVEIPKNGEWKKTRETIKSINKNEVYLYFEAYIVTRSSVQVLCQTLTNPIKNLKNPNSGDLKICKSLNNYGPCDGNTEVALFTERVPPDVKVKMFSRYNDWEDLITPEYMHRNLALTFKTPKYPFSITDDTKVKFCLFRESDGVESNILEFVYQPSSYGSIGVKRKRMDQSPMVCDSVSDEMGLELEGEVRPNKSEILHDIMLSDSSINVSGLLDVFDQEQMADFSGSSIEEFLNCRYLPESDSNEGEDGSRRKMNEDIYWNIDPKYFSFVGSLTDVVVTVQRSASWCSTRVQIEEKVSRILKDIALTNIYSNHLNVLQKLIIQDEPVKLDTTLFYLFHFTHHDSRKLWNDIHNVRNGNKMTLLHLAVQLNKEECVRVLIYYGFRVLDVDNQGNNCFHLSVKYGSFNIVQSLNMPSKQGCCFNHCYYYSPLRKRALKDECYSQCYPYKGYYQTLNAANLDYLNVLHVAVRARKNGVIKKIISLNKKMINSQISTTGDTALHLACRLQYTDIAEELISLKADTSIVNLQGYSPLHISVSMNDYNTAALLIKNKSNPNQICLSLMNSDFDDDQAENDDSEEPNHDCTAYALANDSKMIDILNGKFHSISLDNEDNPTSSSKDDMINGQLLTEVQVKQLTDYLKNKMMWTELVQKLNREHLTPSFFRNFKNPEKTVVNMINLEAKDFFGNINQKQKLIDLFSSLDMKEAEDIIRK